RVVAFAAGAVAASIIAAIAGTRIWLELSRPTPWSVETLRGVPTVSSGARENVLERGGTVLTNTQSSARIAVGRIGVVDVAPASRVELINSGSTQHRLALRYGTLHARIWAPPRFFVVETRTATAVDLGCVYS